MKKATMCLFAVMVFCFLGSTAAHAKDWIYLGSAHVDGQHDHDDIKVRDANGRYRFLQLRVISAPIQFDRIVVHYGNGDSETLHVRDVIPAGGQTRALKLQGDRIVASFELWYAKADPNSGKPEVALYGRQ